MTTSSVIEALNAAGILPERSRAERVRSLTKQELGFFRWILTSFAAGAPPGADDLADAASELGLSVEPALERLRREDLVHHDPETGAILVAYPFSGRPAAHRVRFDGREAYAMCAIDALGIPFMLNVEAEIESRDPLANDAIRVEVDPSAGATWTPEGAVVIAASQAGGGPSCNTRCRYVNFFASAERARRYLTERPSLRAEVLSIPEAIEAGRIVFGSSPASISAVDEGPRERPVRRGARRHEAENRHCSSTRRIPARSVTRISAACDERVERPDRPRPATTKQENEMATIRPDIDIPALAEHLVGVDGLFDRRDERVALTLYRLLAEGEPVSQERLAARAGRSGSEVAEWLRGARVDLDERGRVVAFQGLSLRRTNHVVEVDGRTLYAWCAGDTLLIQDLLRRPARVRSTDPITGGAISLAVADAGAPEVEPSTAVLSMLRADAVPSLLGPDGAAGEDVIPAACGPINFFESAEAGRAFTERVEGTFLLTIEQGVELVRLITRALFGSALGDDSR